MSDQRTSFAQSVRVDDITNDCLYRSVHSSHRYGTVVFVLNPYRDFSVDLSYVQTYNYYWHNSASQNRIDIEEIQVDSYCKGLLFKPTSGAGGGVINVYEITASLGGRGALTYEVCMGIANDSNNPTVGSSAYSYTANGKSYYFYNP